MNDLVEIAKLVAEGVVLSGDHEAMKELSDFLYAFALRQRSKIDGQLANIEASKN